MSLRGGVALTCIVTMLVASTALAATAPPIVRPVACVSAGMNLRISATVPPTLSSPRVFFRANNEKTEYYVDMRRSSGNEWFAILPAIEPSTTSVSYRVAGVDDSKKWVVSPETTIKAVNSCPAGAVMLTPEETSMANGIVLGLTTPGQSEIPNGFSCRGISKILGVDCQLRPAEGCSRLLAQAKVPKAIPKILAGGGEALSNRTLYLILGGGALLALIEFNGQHNRSTSPSRP